MKPVTAFPRTFVLATLALGLGLPVPGHAVVEPAHQMGPPFREGTPPSKKGNGPSAAQTNRLQPGVDYVRDEVLVKFKPNTSTNTRQDVVRGMGDRIARGLDRLPRIALVKIGSDRSVQTVVQAYEADASVEYAEPNYIYRAQKTPNDPQFSDLWGLENTSSPGNDVDAPAAWNHQTDCSGVPVAVLDTGINYEHADLAGNMWGDGTDNHGRDFVDPNDGDPLPDGGATHGTHVAGTIAAVGNNATATAGVCWNAEIMAVRVLGYDGSGTTADIVEGINYAVNNRAKVINMSLGGSYYSQTLKDALATARDNGALVITAAGNAGEDNDITDQYPCNYDLDNNLCIAALDQNYSLASFSNYGDQTVDVGAPGVNILSSYPGATVSAAFSTWHTTDSEWREDTSCSDDFDFLVNPPDWCSGGTYEPNLDSRAYNTFDLSGTQLGAGYHFYLDLALNDSGDSFEAGHFAGDGDPFANNATIDFREYGVFDNSDFNYQTAPLYECLGSQCSVGYRLLTDGSGSANGAAAAVFQLQKVTAEAVQTAYLRGTSMATPHVAGMAALGWAYKSGSSYTEVRDAILQGGDTVAALDGKTTTGREADAYGTLAELNRPPTVSDASMTTTEGTSQSTTLQASDPEDDPLSWSIITPPTSGTASVDGTGKVTYSPDPGYVGSDSFTVEVVDSFGNADTANVGVAVESHGGGGGCALSPTPGKLDPVWLLLIATPWLVRHHFTRTSRKGA